MTTKTTIPAVTKASFAFGSKPISSGSDFDKLIDDFNKAHRSQRDDFATANKALSVAKHENSYHRIAEALAISTVLLDPANETDFARNLLIREISAAKPTENRYLPVVRLLFGHWGEDKLKGDTIKSVWKADRSAEKYANVLRWLDDTKIKPQDAVTQIKTVKGKLKAIEAVDRQKYAKTDPVAKKVQAVLDDMKGIKKREFPLFILDNPERLNAAIGDRKKGVIWFTMDHKDVELCGVLDIDEEELEKLLLKTAKARVKNGTAPQVAATEPAVMEMPMPTAAVKSTETVAA